MFDISNAHHFRKVIAGLCMILAPGLALAGAIVSPELRTNEGAQLAIVADNADRWYISNLLFLAAIVLAVPAVLGLMHMLRERQVAFGHVGGGLGLFGLLMLMAQTAIGMVAWQMVAGGDQGQMAALWDRVNTTAGTFIPFFIGSFAFGAGFLVLAWGLWEARAVHWTMALCMAAGAVALNIAFPVGSLTLAIIGTAVLFVGLGSIGRMILSETEEEWEHTPEFRGFRPAATAG